MKITSTPEKAFNERLLQFLQEIERRSIISGPDKAIEWICDYQTLGEKGMQEEVEFIGRIKEWGIIQVDSKKTIYRDDGVAYLYIQKNYPIFQYAYSLLTHGLEQETVPGDLLNMLRTLVKILQYGEELPSDISDFIEKTETKKKTPEQHRAAELGFNPETGIGNNGAKKFRLKDGSAEHRVFTRLYENINKKVLRYDVLELAHFYEDGEDIDPAREKDETEAINVVAKKIRNKVGLETDQLVMNAGNLTLQGEKVTKSTPD